MRPPGRDRTLTRITVDDLVLFLFGSDFGVGFRIGLRFKLAQKGGIFAAMALSGWRIDISAYDEIGHGF